MHKIYRDSAIEVEKKCLETFTKVRLDEPEIMEMFRNAGEKQKPKFDIRSLVKKMTEKNFPDDMIIETLIEFIDAKDYEIGLYRFMAALLHRNYVSPHPPKPKPEPILKVVK